VTDATDFHYLIREQPRGDKLDGARRQNPHPLLRALNHGAIACRQSNIASFHGSGDLLDHLAGFMRECCELDGEVWPSVLARADSISRPIPNRIERRSFVYAITDGDSVKIGRTRHPDARMRSIQSMSPVPLDVLLCVPESVVTERDLHSQWTHLRTHGEWFTLTDALRQALSRAARKGRGFQVAKRALEGAATRQNGQTELAVDSE
jgi:hypothetical protein